MAERMTGELHGSSAQDLVLGSSDTVVHSNENTTFSAEAPQPGVIAERELAEGTIDIKDSAIGSLVIGSKDTSIDNRGLKTNIKITPIDENTAVGGTDHPESDAPVQAGSVVSNGGIIINSVIDSTDTKICMEGARINVKTKKKKKKHKQPTPGKINVSNSAAVNLVAYSERTDVDMKNAEININY